MRTIILAAVAALALTIPALAAPCNTGATKSKDPTPDHVSPKSSDVDKSSKNLAGGPQPASPGTVGAMNNVGTNQMVGETAVSEAKNDQGTEWVRRARTSPAASSRPRRVPSAP